MLSLFTYEQLEIAFLKQGNCKGKSSWEAERSADAAVIDGLNTKSFTSVWDLKMISRARALRACLNGGSLSLKKEIKKEMKEKGVIERIRHFSAPKIRYSIRSIVCASNMKPPSPWKWAIENSVFFILAAKETQEIARSLRTHVLGCGIPWIDKNRSR